MKILLGCRLSERNCIEIVSLLLEKKLVEVVFTNDGKEYITPDHLEREIQDELYINGGRVNLVEVSKTLNVDLSRVNTKKLYCSSYNQPVYQSCNTLMAFGISGIKKKKYVTSSYAKLEFLRLS